MLSTFGTRAEKAFYEGYLFDRRNFRAQPRGELAHEQRSGEQRVDVWRDDEECAKELRIMREGHRHSPQAKSGIDMSSKNR